MRNRTLFLLLLMLVLGLSSTQVGTRNASSQTTSGTSTYDDAIGITAGSSLTLGVYSQSADLQPGGTWDAEFGTMTPDGHYTAPSYMPPYGLDNAYYTAPDGTRAVLSFRIYADPNVPSSGQPQMTQVTADYLNLPANPFASPTPAPAQAASQTQTGEPAATFHSEDSAVAYSGGGDSEPSPTPTPAASPTPPPNTFYTSYTGTPLVINTSDYAIPVQEYDCVDIEPVAVIATSYTGPAMNSSTSTTTTSTANDQYTLPSQVGGVRSNSLYALQAQGKAKPKKCKVGPYNPPPPWDGKPCSGGPQVVNGPIKTFQHFGPMQDGGEITIDAGLQAKLKGWGINVGVGAKYHVWYQFIYYGVAYTRDVYQCINGHWTFVYREACEAKAIGLFSVPSWWARLSGYPPNGAPGPWTPWSCHRTN